MSTMNPLKFLGGMILEIGAVVAVLAMLPAMGTRGESAYSQSAYPAVPEMNSVSNQVFFDARSSRVVDDRSTHPPTRAAWQSDLIAPPPATQQRFVEDSLDHTSQRALDAAARLWNRGDRLLPPELQVRTQPETLQPVERPAPTWSEPKAPSHYAPRPQFNGRY